MSYQKPHNEWLEKILAKLSGYLSAPECRELDEHLRSCLRCTQAIKDYELLAARIIDITNKEPLPQLPLKMLELKREITQHRLEELKRESIQHELEELRKTAVHWTATGEGLPNISVIIPAMNEAQNLRHVLPLIPSIVSEVILVDGHSIDDTIAVIEQLRTTIRPTIHIIKQTEKGKGDALRVGFAACVGDIIVTLDADGANDPREIPLFVEALLRGNDFAKGSRCISGAGSHDFTLLRRLGNYGLRKLVNLLFWTRFSDLCYGYNAFWRHCLDYIEVDYDGFEVETLIHLRVHKANLSIVEVPSVEYRRIYGKSNLHAFRDGWRVLRTIVRERSKATSPLPRPLGKANHFPESSKANERPKVTSLSEIGIL